MLNIVFECDVEAVGQTDFHLLRPMVIRIAVVNDIVLVNEAGINRTGRKNVRICQRRKA